MLEHLPMVRLQLLAWNSSQNSRFYNRVFGTWVPKDRDQAETLCAPPPVCSANCASVYRQNPKGEPSVGVGNPLCHPAREWQGPWRAYGDGNAAVILEKIQSTTESLTENITFEQKIDMTRSTSRQMSNGRARAWLTHPSRSQVPRHQPCRAAPVEAQHLLLGRLTTQACLSLL